MKRLILSTLLTSAVLSAPLFAQTKPVEAPTLPVVDSPVTQTPLADTPAAGPDKPAQRVKVVGPAGLFAAPVVKRPIKVAVYFGVGSPESNSQMLVDAAKRLEGAQVTGVKAEEFATADLSQYDVVIFAGGSGSGQAKGLGEAGRENVRKFVKSGGGYLGICAGAYLATSCYPWSLGILNATTMQPWYRGGGAVALQLTDAGKSLIGDVKDPFPVRYNNGPVIKPDTKTDLPPYEVVAYFRNELTNKPVQVGQMTDTPAIVKTTFGQGRVMTISPHFEGTKNMENVLPRVIEWLSEKPAAQ